MGKEKVYVQVQQLLFEVGKQQYFGPYQQHYYKQIKILFSAMTMCVY